MKRDSNRNYNAKANSYITEFVNAGKTSDGNRRSSELDMVEMGVRDQSTGAYSQQVNTASLTKSHRDHQPKVPPIPSDVYSRPKQVMARSTNAFSTDPNSGHIIVQQGYYQSRLDQMQNVYGSQEIGSKSFKTF